MNKKNRGMLDSSGKNPKAHGAYKGSGTTKQTSSYKGSADPRYSGAADSGGKTKQSASFKGSGSTKQHGNYKKGSTRYAGAL